MRTFISCITTLATVMHLAFGCCLHAAHFDAAAACCTAGHAATHDCDCDCADDHGHDHGAAHESADEPASAPGQEQRVGAADAAGHACAGCHCTALIEVRRSSPAAHQSNCPVVAFDAGSLVPLQAARGPCEMARRPVLSALSPPLFERLTV